MCFCMRFVCVFVCVLYVFCISFGCVLYVFCMCSPSSFMHGLTGNVIKDKRNVKDLLN